MSSVAGPEVGRPTSIDEVTPEWLTTVLRTSGAIDAGTTVISSPAKPFAEGLGFLSDLFRAELAYDGGEGPASVIVKFPTAMPTQRAIADGLQFYQRELRFYRELAPTAPFRVPQAHAAAMAEDSSDFVLVMDELAGLRGFDQIAGATGADAVVAARSLAAFHARFWGQDLSDLETTFFPLDNPVHQVVLPQIFAAGWERCKAEGTEILTPEVTAYGDRYVELLPWALNELSTGATLVHGDWRADNLFLDDDGNLAVIDFQITGTGAGIYDLGYFLSQSMEPEDRVAAEPEVLSAYFGGLDDAGVDYDREAELRSLRLTMAFCLIYPVSIFGGWDDVPANGQALMLAGLRRSVEAIVDHDALSLLPN